MKHEMKNKIKINSDGNCVIENWHYPAVGFGTYPLRDGICEKSVNEALEIGYRIGNRERVTKEAGVGFTDEFDFSLEDCWPKLKEGSHFFRQICV